MNNIVAGKPQVAKNDYVVEKIDGVKMEDGELQFFVKWEGVSENKTMCFLELIFFFSILFRTAPSSLTST